MKNFIFLSPNFPENYWRFCAALRGRGMRVLGIGDCPYDALREEVRRSLDEYYYVTSLEHYDEVYGAVAFFAFKYGKPDWLESNNEYWLERDARLREDFNIASGFHPADMPSVKLKSRMKACYRQGGIPVARYCMTDDFGPGRTVLGACRRKAGQRRGGECDLSHFERERFGGVLFAPACGVYHGGIHRRHHLLV